MTTIPAASRPVPLDPSRLAWLREESGRWRDEGVLDAEQQAALLARYVPDPRLQPGFLRRLGLARLFLTVGCSFLGIGVLWLVAAHLDDLSGTTRMVGAVACWLGALLGAERLARADGDRSVPSPVTGGVRLLAALLFGAVVFQGAQLVQVPANDPGLVLAWCLGALAQAYAVRAVMPLLVASVTGWVWLGLTAARQLEGLADWSVVNPVPLILAVGLLLASVAVLHRGRWWELGQVWRESSAALALLGLFLAGLPQVYPPSAPLPAITVELLALAAMALLAAVVTALVAAPGTGPRLAEPLVVLAAAGVAAALIRWAPAHASSPAGWAHTALALTAYVVLALWVCVLAQRVESGRLTVVATGALVVFVTVQSFEAVAPFVQGAWLFLVLGLVLAGTGWAFDRARRRLTAGERQEQR